MVSGHGAGTCRPVCKRGGSCFSSSGRSGALGLAPFGLMGGWCRSQGAHQPRETGDARPEPAVARVPWWKVKAKIGPAAASAAASLDELGQFVPRQKKY